MLLRLAFESLRGYKKLHQKLDQNGFAIRNVAEHFEGGWKCSRVFKQSGFVVIFAKDNFRKNTEIGT